MVGYLMILLFRGTQCEPLKFQRTFAEWKGLPEKPLLHVSSSRGFFFSISYICMCATKRYAFSTQLFCSELNNVSCFLKPEFGIRCLFFILGLSRTADYRDVWLNQLYRQRSGNNEPVSYIYALYGPLHSKVQGSKSLIFFSEIGWGGGRAGTLSQPHL